MQNSQKKINFVFWGTPDVAEKTLEILKHAGYLPKLIITSPDRPRGRKMIVTPPLVKVWAKENNIDFIQPENLKSGIDLSKYDLSIVVAYGKIIPEKILNEPRLGSINVHYSILPKYRGASPVESAILNGEKETGVTIQQMEFKMDSGPILALEKIQINEAETAIELKEKLTKIGGDLLVKILPDFVDGKIQSKKQNEEGATFSRKIKKEDGFIDLNGDPFKNYAKFKAYVKWPRTFFFREGQRFIITRARLENDKFVIEKVIPEGGKEIDFKINI